MNIVNLTPHTVTFRNHIGVDVEFPSVGLARVSTTSEKVKSNPFPIIRTIWGKVEGLPGVLPPCQNCNGAGCVGDIQGFDGCLSPCPYCDMGLVKDAPIYIVSLIVLSHPSVKGRTDVVAPATGPNDGAIRFEDGPRKGQIIAVTRFVVA